MEEIVSISKKEYQELQVFKKLVINNLLEEIAPKELAKIEKARKSKLISEEEAEKRYPSFFK